MNNDSASVDLSFKNAGINFMNSEVRLHAAATYQYMKIPFNLTSSPDSVIVSMQSSVWQDSALVFVGSDLKIDEMHFKSQPLSNGIINLSKNSEVSFYPNPFKTIGTILIGQEINTQGMEVSILDVTGRIVEKNRNR